ncbi:nucleoside triphosphate pyrophosphatase [Rhodosalinus sp. 5P4]|uniref:Maf family protein n=1 Tax=Rhodosalinus sp. 5P4 TaxID=3239196 RepID=UPI003523AB5C
MSDAIVLASGSAIRASMLRQAGLEIETVPARLDESAVKASMEADGTPPRDLADALAEMKARKVSDRIAGRLVLGCDQVLAHEGTVLSKPRSAEEARDQLQRLRGTSHRLLSAAVACRDGRPLWRHVGEARLVMREFSDQYLADYVARNWPGLGESVGGYKLEEEGVRLFSAIEGDHFTILGLPLLPLLSWLTVAGEIEG